MTILGFVYFLNSVQTFRVIYILLYSDWPIVWGQLQMNVHNNTAQLFYQYVEEKFGRRDTFFANAYKPKLEVSKSISNMHSALRMKCHRLYLGPDFLYGHDWKILSSRLDVWGTFDYRKYSTRQCKPWSKSCHPTGHKSHTQNNEYRWLRDKKDIRRRI